MQGISDRIHPILPAIFLSLLSIVHCSLFVARVEEIKEAMYVFFDSKFLLWPRKKMRFIV